MLAVIREHTPETIWTDAPLEPFRRVANTNRGDIGEDFVQRYLQRHGIVANRVGSRISAADLEIGGKLFEVKTASEDQGGLQGCVWARSGKRALPVRRRLAA